MISLLALGRFSGANANTSNSSTTGIMRDFYGFFEAKIGDAHSSTLLDQVLGPLFLPGAAGAGGTVFSGIVGVLNSIVLAVGGLLLLYNLVAGTLQTAHEGVVLGRRWSSLWSPLRVLFAVVLLMPVPGLGGYNAIQAGIAWLVKGSTAMASEIWSLGADEILSGRLPIAGTAQGFDAEVFETIYRNQLCRKLANYQFETAGSELRVVFRELRTEESITYMSQINGRRYGICGSYGIPKTPDYISQVADTASGPLSTFFLRLHTGLLISLVEATDRILDAQWPAVIDNSGGLPDTTGQVLNAIESVESQLTAGNRELIDRVADQYSGQGTAREILNRFIRGQGCSLRPGENEGLLSETCEGPGWIGAGNWYILLARANSEIMGLVNASINATESTYLTDESNKFSRVLVREADASGWFSQLFTPVDAGKYMHLAETERIFNTLTTEFSDNLSRLVVSGFVLPENLLEELAGASNAPGLIGKIWKTGFANGVGEMIEILSPSNWDDDPIIGIVNMGNWYLNAAGALVFGGMGVSLFSGALSTTIVFLIAAPLAVIGISQSFILPMLPFFVWILSVAAYFLLVIEAVIGGSLWAVGHMRLDGEGISGDSGRQGWYYLFALVLTPPLMVTGYFAGMALFRIASGLLDTGLYYAMSALVNASPIVGIFGLIATGSLIVVSYAAVMERSFSLVSELPGRVLRWIGAEAELSDHAGLRRIQAGSKTLGSAVHGGIGLLGRKSSVSSRSAARPV